LHKLQEHYYISNLQDKTNHGQNLKSILGRVLVSIPLSFSE